jgi:fructokinase
MVSVAMPALGIDLGGTKIEARLLARDGHEIWRQRRATPAGDYAGIVRTVASMVGAARNAAGGQAFTVGIGTPGTETAAGVMKNCNSVCLNGMPLQRDLQVAIGQPVRLANDANCLALSEATDGAGAGSGVVFAAILGTGTGAGIAVNGRILAGANGLTGEWGHNSLPFGRPGEDPVFECYCGQRGCIETLVSGPGIARDHEQVNRETLTGEQIAARASAGDKACQATIERHTRRLARSLASVINLLDPDVIVLGGGLSLLPHLYTRVPALWNEWVFSGGVKDPVRTRLEPSKHGDASGARGAAWLWWQD